MMLNKNFIAFILFLFIGNRMNAQVIDEEIIEEEILEEEIFDENISEDAVITENTFNYPLKEKTLKK